MGSYMCYENESDCTKLCSPYLLGVCRYVKSVNDIPT